MKVLVIAEHDQKHLKADTSKTLAAAKLISEQIDVLVAGEGIASIAEQASLLAGVSRVITLDNPVLKDSLAEPLAEAILQMTNDYTHVLAPASTFGKNILPRVAAKLDVMQLSDVIEVIDPDTYKRPIYAGNAIATVKSLDPIKVMTIRSSAFDGVGEQAAAEVCASDLPLQNNGLSELISRQQTESERPELGAARVVISGGRGMQNSENFQLLEKVADKLDAAIGASRAAVDAGFVANDMQVGQTGKIVAPDLYIAVGISGAIQHLAGMKDSKVVVAINKDPDAPIFQVADYGLVADLFDVLPELEQKL